MEAVSHTYYNLEKIIPNLDEHEEIYKGKAFQKGPWLGKVKGPEIAEAAQLTGPASPQQSCGEGVVPTILYIRQLKLKGIKLKLKTCLIPGHGWGAWSRSQACH